MGESKVLQAHGVFKGNLENRVQFFNVVGEDENGVTYSMHFMCKDHYTETIINAFKRLHPVKLNRPIEPVAEGEKTDGQPTA